MSLPIRSRDGALKKVEGSPFKAGGRPWGIATSIVNGSKCIPSPL